MAGDVTIARFDWQTQMTPALAVVPMLRKLEPVSTVVASAMRDLPSFSVERL